MYYSGFAYRTHYMRSAGFGQPLIISDSTAVKTTSVVGTTAATPRNSLHVNTVGKSLIYLNGFFESLLVNVHNAKV